MAVSDISPVVARLKNRIESVANIGLVADHDLYSRDDLRPVLVSTILGAPTLRAWWITGPSMDGVNMVQTAAGHIERTWTYTIFGVEGLSASGDSVLTLRTNALAVSDAIDADRDLNGTVHRTLPCKWRVAPQNRAGWRGVAVSYVEITKQVITLSTP